MIPVERLIYKIDLKLNKLASNVHQDIPIEDKIIALNEAQIRLLKKKVNQNNLYKLGFEAFKSRYEELQVLVVDYEEAATTKTTQVLTSFSFSTENLKSKYYLPIDIIVKADKGECKDHNVYVKRIVKHGDLVTLLNNPHYAPSFSYQETLATMADNEVVVYTKDDFEITKAFFSYLRYPKEIDFPGYIKLDGEESEKQDCELPEFLEDELVELTILELATNIENITAAQAAQTKITE